MDGSKVQYIEIAIGDVKNRGHIIPLSDLRKYMHPNEELFRSYFNFDEKIIEHIRNDKRKTPNPGGFIGNFGLNQIVIDIDRGKNAFDITVNKAKVIVNRLIKEFDLEDNFQIWFSGTGFHIHIPNIFGFEPSNNLPQIVKSTIEGYFPEADLMPIHSRGLIRVGRTINSKSNLYKIPIKESEIWFLKESDVQEWAKTPRESVSIVKYAPLTKHYTIINPPPKEETLIKVHRPNEIVTCMQHCYNAGEVEGTRHKRIMSMASWQYRNGTPVEGTIAMMKSYAKTMDPYEVEKTVVDLYNKGGYNYGCESEVMKQFCDPQCIFHNKKNYLPEIFGTKEVEAQYVKEMESGWKESSLNIASFLGIIDPKGYWIRPGHLVGIQGDTGLSKSALMQNLALTFRNFGKFLYINTEMPHTELYERFVQIEMEIDSEEVRERHLKGLGGFGTILDHIEYTKNTPDFLEIINLVNKIKPRVVIIDVVDDIKPGNGKERSVRSEEDMYAELKSLIRKTKSICFLVHHINKGAAVDEKGNRKMINAHSGKGSSAFEQKCDMLIGIEGIATQPYRTLKSLKGRSTAPFQSYYKVESDTFKFKLEKV